MIGTEYLHIMWLRNTPSSRLVVEFSLYKCRIPLVTSTNGFPETKLIVSVFPLTLPSKGVESLVDLREEVTEELFLHKCIDRAIVENVLKMLDADLLFTLCSKSLALALRIPDKSFNNFLNQLLKCLDIKWAVTLHLDSLKICYFDFRGGVILHQEAGFHFKKTHATS